MKIDACFTALVSAAIISALIALDASAAAGAERKQEIAQLEEELERESAGREAAPDWLLKLGRHAFNRGLDLELPAAALKAIGKAIRFNKALQDKLQKMDDAARLKYVNRLIDDVRKSVPAGPQKDDERKRGAAEVFKLRGRGDLSRLPAPMGLVAQFLPQPDMPKKLVLEHENVNAMLIDAQGDVRPATSEAFAYNNTKLREFIEGNERLRSMFGFPPQHTFLPASAPLLADYDFIGFVTWSGFMLPGRLRVHGDAFVAAGGPWRKGLVGGVRNEPLQADLKLSSAGGAVFALERKVAGKAFGASLAVLVDFEDDASETPAASWSVKTALIGGDGKERLSIPFTAELQIVPLGFGAHAGEFMAWNAIAKVNKVTEVKEVRGEFGYYDIAKHKFFPTQTIFPVDKSGTPAYSMKPYSTLCVVHDQMSKLTIFDPRFVGAQLVLAMPDLQGSPLHGVCLKWNDKSKLTHVAFWTALPGLNWGSRVDIYKVVDAVPEGSERILSATLRHVTEEIVPKSIAKRVASPAPEEESLPERPSYERDYEEYRLPID